MLEPRLTAPTILPAEPGAALAYLNGLMQGHYEMLLELRESFYSESHSAPAKLREGMIRFADGTDWNPGSGRGLYQYVSGSWTKL